ncbi:MAG: hypothetical protein QE271_11735 [Bacteriovoracaceae bacterium]|nr:hypothetical protein [Bacteriovoracaceae bacterium]
MSIEILVYSFLLVQAFFVSLVDIKHKMISNHWIYLNLACFGILFFLYPHIYSVSITPFLMASTFLAVGFVLYFLKVMGAGDSKYLFTFFLLIPPPWLDGAFFDLLVCTMVIGSFSLFTTIAQNFQRMSLYARTGYIRGFRECLGTKFPFAPVILISWAWLGIKVFYLGL